MARLRFLTAGESHGKALTIIIEGLPAGLPLDAAVIDEHLARRQKGYGRGGRMKIEKDRVEITAGVRYGKTLGSPLAMVIPNLDWKNWQKVMSVTATPEVKEDIVTAPRPGHADLAGGMKYGTKDLRNVLERASARETAARVAAGAVFLSFLSHFGVTVLSMVEEIGGVKAILPDRPDERTREKVESSLLRCPDEEGESLMKARIDKAMEDGDSLGGIFVVITAGLVPGLGSYVHWDRRMDTRLAAALMSIPAIKGVEIGLGFRGASLTGTQFHDEIEITGKTVENKPSFYRKTNNSGGLEGGVTTGENLVLRAFMKPIPTMARPLATIDVVSGEATSAHKERADVCAVPAAAVVGEAMCAAVLAEAYLEKYGGDTLEEVRDSHDRYLSGLSRY